MDGFEENDRIIVVAATNFASNLDPALQRPGRFDRKIEIKLPTVQERSQILKIHLKNKTHSVTDEHINVVSSLTDGMSGADLENLVNLAALQAVRKARINREENPQMEGEDFLNYAREF